MTICSGAARNRSTALRISGYPGIRISGYPDIRISGYPDIRIPGYPDIKKALTQITKTSKMANPVKHCENCTFHFSVLVPRQPTPRYLQLRTKKTEQTFRLLSKTYRNPEMFFDHNRAGKWRSRHDSAIILHEISARIFLVKSDTPFCSVAGWCSQEASVKYIRNRRNVMNMSSTKIENGGFGLKLCGNECRSNHTSFRTGLDPKYSYKKV